MCKLILRQGLWGNTFLSKSIRWHPLSKNEIRAGIAQLVEQLICNHQVIGSSPIFGSIVA